MKEPLVSIVIAVYNGEKYLDECIRSIARQTYRNIEVILIDDGSSDGSGKICDAWTKKDERVAVIHQDNHGVSAARNIGIKKAKGKYLCLIDQDDFIDKDYVKYLLQMIMESGAEIATIPNVIFYTDDKYFYIDSDKNGRKEIWSGNETACNMLCGKMEIGPWNKMISMALLEERKIRFHEELFGGEGYVFSIESFSSAKKVAVGYDGMYYYRVDNNTSEMSRYRSRTFYSSTRAIEIMKDEFKNNKKILSAVMFAEWRVYVSFLHALLASGTKKGHANDYRILKKKCRLYAYRNLFAPVSLKMKIKGLLYLVSPVLITKYDLRRQTIRRFSKKESEDE